MKKSSGMTCHVLVNLSRTIGKTLLSIFLPFVFVISLVWMSGNIYKNQRRVQELYRNTQVRGMLTTEEEDEIWNPRYLMSTIFQEFEDANEVTDEYLEAVVDGSITVSDENVTVQVRGLTSAQGYQEIRLQNSGTFRWLDGYSAAYFEQTYDSAKSFEQNPGIVLNAAYADMWGLELGDTLEEFCIRDGFSYTEVPIVGILENSVVNEQFLVPIELLEHQMESPGMDVIFYNKIYFTVGSEWNSHLDDFARQMESRLSQPDATIFVKLKLILFDDELKNAVEPLEKTVRTLELLLPIMVAVYLICIAAISILYTMQEQKEIAVKRILGTPIRQILWATEEKRLFTGITGVIGGSLFGIVLFPDGWRAGVWWLMVFDIVCVTVSVIASFAIVAWLCRKDPLSQLADKG